MNIRNAFVALVSLASITSAAEAAPTTYTFTTAMSDWQGATATMSGSYTIDPTIPDPSQQYSIYDAYQHPNPNTLNLTAFSASGSITNAAGTESVSYSLADLGIFNVHLDANGNIDEYGFGTNGKLLPNTLYTAFGVQWNGSAQSYIDSDTNYLTGNFVSAASPAPEPGVWAMMVSGLGLVGAAAVRRRRSALVA